MTSDVAIVMLSINLVAYLKIRLSRKVAVVACFAPRLLVIGAALARLVYLYPISPHNNPAFHLWIPLIITQVQACLSIVTACIPYVRAFFEPTESSIRRRSQARSKHVTIDEESYGCFGHARGYRKAHDHSKESTAFGDSAYGIASDASPRIPSPRPFSPLIAPFDTPPNTSASGSRTPSERGLRLVIPEQTKTHHGDDLTSPQTASSHALSPAPQSPHPLLPSIALAPIRSSFLPAADKTTSRLAMESENNATLSPNRPQPPRRFSLFPSQHQQYSPIPQQRTRPPLTIPSPITERSRTNTVSPMRPIPVSQIPEARWPSPNAPLPEPPTPRLMLTLRPSSSLERVAHDDPLRIGPIAMTTSEAVPAPIPAIIPIGHDTIGTNASIPSYYVRTPSTAHNSTFSSPQSVPSYYIRTPPTAHPPVFPQPNPYAHEAPPPPNPPTSPQRQRNKRVLTPQNSSRRDQMSPVSPMTPSRSLWCEENGNRNAETPNSSGGWDEAPPMPTVRDVRNSPRIVVQTFS
jgi:hypothetical protein